MKSLLHGLPLSYLHVKCCCYGERYKRDHKQNLPPSYIKVRQQQVTSKLVNELVITDSCRRYTDPPCWSNRGSLWSLVVSCGV